MPKQRGGNLELQLLAMGVSVSDRPYLSMRIILTIE